MSRYSKKIFLEDIRKKEFCYLPKSKFFDQPEYKVSNENFPQEFFSIVAIFEEDCNFNVKKLYSDSGRLFIYGQNSRGDSNNELMLRYGNNELIVARVKFIHTREGNMTRLYKILKQIRKKYKLNKIIIECCNSDSASWCTKNGFVTMEGDKTSYVEK